MSERGIEGLPEGCISHIISFTSPANACRLAAVSPIFRAAAESDTVWERFLPFDVREIISRADNPPEYSSFKELFFLLCNSIVIDGGRKIFALEKSSCRKCFVLSARDLTITWGDSPKYWQWISVPDSRFPDVALLLEVCLLQIDGRINCRMLSKKTNYVVYFVYRIAERSNGLNFPQRALIKMGPSVYQRTVCLDPDWDDDDDDDDRDVPERDDGWLKIKMGEFFCDDGEEGDVEFSLVENIGGHWKRGLIFQGIELRPSFYTL